MNLASIDLKDALRPYTIQGTYGQIFDADHEDLHDGFVWRGVTVSNPFAPAASKPALERFLHGR